MRIKDCTIYNTIKARDPRCEFVAKTDIMQSIRLGMLESGVEIDMTDFSCEYDKEVYRCACKRVNELFSDYGYKRKADKELRLPENAEYTEPASDLTPEQWNKIDFILKIYRTHTVKELCAILEIPFDNNLQKFFTRYFPKGMQWGGRRVNAGRKRECA